MLTIPYYGYLVHFVGTPLGFVLFVLVPAIILIANVVRKILRKEKVRTLESKLKRKGKPIFCGSDGKWKGELEKRLQKSDEIVLLALGDVKYEVLAYLNKRGDIEISGLETRYMKKQEKGTGLKATVKRRSIQGLP